MTYEEVPEREEREEEDVEGRESDSPRFAARCRRRTPVACRASRSSDGISSSARAIVARACLFIQPSRRYSRVRSLTAETASSESPSMRSERVMFRRQPDAYLTTMASS